MRVLSQIGNAEFTAAMKAAVRGDRASANAMVRKIGFEQYYLHTAFPDIFPPDVPLGLVAAPFGSALEADRPALEVKRLLHRHRDGRVGGPAGFFPGHNDLGHDL